MTRTHRQLEINLGKACNNRCVFCSNGAVPAEERRFVDHSVIIDEMERGADEGHDSVGFLGGEPTIYPSLRRVVRRAAELGFRRIALCTNGRRLADEAFLADIVEAGVNRITLSFHSQHAEIEDRLCGRRNAYDQKVKAIRNISAGMSRSLYDLSQGFAVNTCIHGLNHAQLVSLATFLKELGVDDVRLNLIRPEHRAVGDRRLVPRLSEVVASLCRLFVWNESSGGLRLTVSDIPVCLLPRPLLEAPGLVSRYMGENWDLDTSVVVYRERGRLRDDFNWRERRADRLKLKPDECATCLLRSSCEGVWIRYLEIYGSGELRPLHTLPETMRRPDEPRSR